MNQNIAIYANLSTNQKAGRLKAAGYRKRTLYIRNPTQEPIWCMEYDPYTKISCWVGKNYETGNTTHVWVDIERAWQYALSVGDVK